MINIAFILLNFNRNRGDTKNELLKVDLRLCLNYGGKLYDLSNIEFKKNGNEQKLVKADSAKVLIEGKTIMNKLFEIYNVDFQEATKMKIVVGQACGNIYNFGCLMIIIIKV